MAGYTRNPTDNAYTPMGVGSTRNPGGDWDSGRRQGGDPFEYVKLDPEHAYLEHFRSPKFLRQGHNVARSIVFPKGASVGTKSRLRPTAPIDVRPQSQRDVEHPVASARRQLAGTVTAAKLAGRAGVLTARATGGDVGAARAARRAGVAEARGARRATVQAAFASPESRRSERGAAMAARGVERATARSARLTKRAEKLTRRAARLGGGY